MRAEPARVYRQPFGAQRVVEPQPLVNTAAFVCTQNGAWPTYPDQMPDYLAEAGM